MGEHTIRDRLLDGAARFVRAAAGIPGVRRIALIGSIVTDKPNPKDIDLLVTVTHDADLAPLALCARRLVRRIVETEACITKAHVSIDGYVIRLAEPDDIAVLPSVEKQAVRLFQEWLAATGLTPAGLEEVSTVEEFEEARKRGHLWVALAPDGEVIGFALVIILDQCAHLDELDVVPEHGRKGVGSKLLAIVCQWAREAGYSKVTLSTFRHVPWNAPFYASKGFRVVDPQRLWPEHVKLVAAERARGLRTDLRVIMEYRTAG